MSVLTPHLRNEIGILFLAIISIKLILFHISFKRDNIVSLLRSSMLEKISLIISLASTSTFIHLDFAKELFEGAMATFIEVCFFFLYLTLTYNNTYTSWESPGDCYKNWNSSNKS